ncbi:MAG: RNA-binding domain-containing protein [Candidatus Verstraetearchaeota archaeon]|nr:RNA-binding domain-containing protein [Candidatus Verstraetearchaeota archaeon]
MISKVSISLICHATEDPKKVEWALLNSIPEGLRGVVKINATLAKGHHGNEIRLISLDEESPAAGEIVNHIMNLLPVGDRIRIRDELDRFYDSRSTVFLRLDKQKAFGGQLRLSEGDDIMRVKISLDLTKGNIAELLQLLDLA